MVTQSILTTIHARTDTVKLYRDRGGEDEREEEVGREGFRVKRELDHNSPGKSQVRRLHRCRRVSKGTVRCCYRYRTVLL